MAEVVPDVEPAVEVEEPSTTATSDLPSFDDSLLIKVKGKVKRPAKPDDTERNIQVDKLQAEIKKQSERIKEIKTLEETRRSNRGPNPAHQANIGRQQALKNEFQTMLRQKQHIRDELQDALKQRDALRNEQRSLREQLQSSHVPGVRGFDQVEAKLEELEWKMAHDTQSAQEEKRLTDQIRSLTALRPLAARYAQVEALHKQVEANKSLISKRLTDCDGVLNEIQRKLEAERAELSALQGKDKLETVDFAALGVEKQECWQVICALREKIDEIRKDFNTKYQEYIKLDKNYNAWLRWDKRQKWEQRQKEREERDAARAENEAAATGEVSGAQPYESEIFTIDQLLTYLRKFLSTEEAAAKEEKKEVEVPKGMKLFKRKDDDMDFFKVEKKAKGKGAVAPAAASKPAPEAKKKLNHSLETLKTLMTLGIEVPQTTAEIAATVEKVEAKREHFLELRKKAKEAPVRKPAPVAEPSSSKAEEAEAEEAEEEPAANGQEPEAEAEAEKEAEAPAAAEEAAAAAAEAPAAEEAAAPSGGVAVTLAVDSATEAVSLKLKL